jgi:peptidyl-dipeptidase A
MLSAQQEADAFLASFVEGWLPLETTANEASWVALMDVTEAHTIAQVAKNQVLSEYVGARPVIETVLRLLGRKDELSELTVRQLEKVRLRAAESPATISEVVRTRTLAEARQAASQDGYTFTLKRADQPEKNLSANDIDRILVYSSDLPERQDV